MQFAAETDFENTPYYNVKDMKRAVPFYRDAFGLTVTNETEYWSSLTHVQRGFPIFLRIRQIWIAPEKPKNHYLGF